MRRGFEEKLPRLKFVQKSIFCVPHGLPKYAKDLKLNYCSLMKKNTKLTVQQQLWEKVVATTVRRRLLRHVCQPW